MMAEATGTNGSSLAPPPVRFLIINPNTSTSMTDALKPMVQNLGYSPVSYSFFTCPADPGSIPSINSPADAEKSAEICLPHLLPQLAHHDAFLVACYSQHPLVGLLKAECDKLGAATTTSTSTSTTTRRKYVTGIYEASVTTSLSLISDAQSFGIVSTGKVWEAALEKAVHEFVGIGGSGSSGSSKTQGGSEKFVGCETTGLNATELHDLPAEEVRAKMTEATKRLVLRGGLGGGKSGSGSGSEGEGEGPLPVHAICLGCAGMVGLDDAVRQGCVDVLGDRDGRAVCIVDGVKAGVGTLFALATAGF